MRNVLNIAKKEFKDLLGDRVLVVISVVLLLYIFLDLWEIYRLLSNGSFDVDFSVNRNDPVAYLAGVAVDQHAYVLARYGALLAIAIGFLSIAGERHSGALSTLVSKPVSRNTIITGKTLGALSFLLCVFTMATLVLAIGLLVICGGRIAPLIGEYLARLPLAIFAALLYVLILYFLSMFMALLVKNYAFSLILSLIAWSIFELVRIYTFGGYIAMFLGDEEGITTLLCSLSPDGIIKNICLDVLTDFSVNVTGCIELMKPMIAKLAIYVIILALITYATFRWRDIE